MPKTRFFTAKEVPAPHSPVEQSLEPNVKKYSIEELDKLKSLNTAKVEIRYVQTKDGNNDLQESYIVVGKNEDGAVLGAAAPCPPFCIPPKETPADFTISEAIHYVLS
jgi:hypothetical protein